MSDELSKQTHTIFEQIRPTDANGNQFWSARDMSEVLEYSEYRHFLPVVEKAKEACRNSKQQVADHFEDILDMIMIGSGAERPIENIKLSRYACYRVQPSLTRRESFFASSRGLEPTATFNTSLRDESDAGWSSYAPLFCANYRIPLSLIKRLTKNLHMPA